MKNTRGPAIAIHGGAGSAPIEKVKLRIPFICEALSTGWECLSRGKPGEYAVEAALRVMESCGQFNAGAGSYPNEEGRIYLDVALMKGNRDYFSIMNLKQVHMPSSLALDNLKEKPCLSIVWTEEHHAALMALSNELRTRYGVQESEMVVGENELRRGETGTVGVVVRDAKGELAAGTSTGGVNGKPHGRVGDSPIIGAGVFADSEICALSTTGVGESFLKSLTSGFIIAEIRNQLRTNPNCFTQDPHLLKKILNSELGELERKAPKKGGGIIVMPPEGAPEFSLNVPEMAVGLKYQGVKGVEQDAFVALLDGSQLRE